MTFLSEHCVGLQPPWREAIIFPESWEVHLSGVPHELTINGHLFAVVLALEHTRSQDETLPPRPFAGDISLHLAGDERKATKSEQTRQHPRQLAAMQEISTTYLILRGLRLLLAAVVGVTFLYYASPTFFARRRYATEDLRK